MAVRLPLFQFSQQHIRTPFNFFQKIILLCTVQWALYSAYPIPAYILCGMLSIIVSIAIPGAYRQIAKSLLLFSPILGLSALFMVISGEVSQNRIVTYLLQLTASVLSGSVLFISTSHYDYMNFIRKLARIRILSGFAFVLSFIFVFLLHIGESYCTLRDALLLRRIRPMRNPIRYTWYLSLGLMQEQLRYVCTLHDVLVLKQFTMEAWKTDVRISPRYNWALTVLLACLLIAYPSAWQFISS